MTTLRSPKGRMATLTAASLCGALSVGSPAFAAPPSFPERHPELKVPDTSNESPSDAETRKARARQEFMAGTSALDAKHWADCEAHLAVAWMLQHSPAVAGNLGLCEVELGYFVDALEHLAFADDNYDPTGKDAATVAEFRKRVAAAKARAKAGVGGLKVESAPPGTTVRVGAKLTFTTPHETVPLYPGEYAVELRKDGVTLDSQTVTIAAGGAVVLVLRGTSPVTTAHPDGAPPPPSAEPGPRLPLVIGGGAFTLAFAGLGAGFLAASQAKLNEAFALRKQIGAIFGSQVGACHAPAGTLVDLCKKLDATTDDAAIFQRVGFVSLVAGGAFAVGTTIYGLWPRPPRAPERRARAASFQIGASASAGPSGGALSVQGSW